MKKFVETVTLSLDTTDRYKECCAFCKYFQSAYGRANRQGGMALWVDDEGWCTRYPPVFVGGEEDFADESGTVRFKQPGVWGHDECGEHVLTPWIRVVHE